MSPGSSARHQPSSHRLGPNASLAEGAIALASHGLEHWGPRRLDHMKRCRSSAPTVKRPPFHAGDQFRSETELSASAVPDCPRRRRQPKIDAALSLPRHLQNVASGRRSAHVAAARTRRYSRSSADRRRSTPVEDAMNIAAADADGRGWRARLPRAVWSLRSRP